MWYYDSNDMDFVSRYMMFLFGEMMNEFHDQGLTAMKNYIEKGEAYPDKDEQPAQ